jgi:asparagine synthase (glutamine-hydrolysing)
MCGIAGIFGPELTLHALEAMTTALHHRGPDARGTYCIPDQSIGLAHTRLSILDLSPQGLQPMADATGQRHLVFNGEIYNYLELREILSEYPFRSNSDTEVILAAYDKWGVDCLSRFVGMFSFALWDAKTSVLFCARDRLGIKPFLYSWDGRTFRFASEAKALFAAGVDSRPNHETFATYLAHGLYDHSDSTFFAQVHSLPAGHFMLLSPASAPAPRQYWSVRIPDACDVAPIREEEAIERLGDLLFDAVRIRLRSDVPLGLNFSGGLDSFTLMSIMEQLSPLSQRLDASTACFREPQYDETWFTRRLMDQERWNSFELPTAPGEIPGLMHEALWHQEAPIGGVSTLAYHKLHREHRKRGVVVQLEAQGVDELFGGYAYYSRLADGTQSIDAWLGASTYQDASPFLAPEVLAPDFARLGNPALPDRPSTLAAPLEQALKIDLIYRKLPRVLRMNDRLSMASGIELREPFLDHRLVEFTFTLPSSLKIRDGVSKYLVRRLIAGRHPEKAALLQTKRAVVAPQREWLRGPLASWVGDLLHSAALRDCGYFHIPALQNRFRNYLAHGADNSFFLWQWCNIALWFETFGKLAHTTAQASTEQPCAFSA